MLDSQRLRRSPVCECTCSLATPIPPHQVPARHLTTLLSCFCTLQAKNEGWNDDKDYDTCGCAACKQRACGNEVRSGVHAHEDASVGESVAAEVYGMAVGRIEDEEAAGSSACRLPLGSCVSRWSHRCSEAHRPRCCLCPPSDVIAIAIGILSPLSPSSPPSHQG